MFLGSLPAHTFNYLELERVGLQERVALSPASIIIMSADSTMEIWV
jgi:hypothetical protein